MTWPFENTTYVYAYLDALNLECLLFRILMKEMRDGGTWIKTY